jgi:hypothetical protein
MRNLDPSFQELQTYLVHADKTRPEVSAVSVGWHIEHILLALIKTSEAVVKSNPGQYKWEFNWLRSILFSLNRFPRGKGKAPEIVRPKENERRDLYALYDEGIIALEALKKAEPNQHFKHGTFGILNKKNTFVMMDIHLRHHLDIMKDIVKNSR